MCSREKQLACCTMWTLAHSLGAGAQGYGRMMTAFGVVQFFGGLVAGPLADTYSGELLVCPNRAYVNLMQRLITLSLSY